MGDECSTCGRDEKDLLSLVGRPNGSSQELRHMLQDNVK